MFSHLHLSLLEWANKYERGVTYSTHGGYEINSLKSGNVRQIHASMGADWLQQTQMGCSSSKIVTKIRIVLNIKVANISFTNLLVPIRARQFFSSS